MRHEEPRAGLSDSDGSDRDAAVAGPSCGYCATNGGVYDIAARCCQVRLVARMPRKLRLAYYQRLQSEFGPERARDMAEAVKRFHVEREEK